MNVLLVRITAKRPGKNLKRLTKVTIWMNAKKRLNETVGENLNLMRV